MKIDTKEEPSKEGMKRTREAKNLVQDARENVGAPSNQCRKRRSPYQYTNYMALTIEIVETKASFFKEVVEKLVWVDTMVEEYDSIVKKSV